MAQLNLTRRSTLTPFGTSKLSVRSKLVAQLPETINAAERVVMLKDGLALEVRASTNSPANSHIAKNEEEVLVA
jgi:hypothetical protein